MKQPVQTDLSSNINSNLEDSVRAVCAIIFSFFAYNLKHRLSDDISAVFDPNNDLENGSPDTKTIYGQIAKELSSYGDEVNDNSPVFDLSLDEALFFQEVLMRELSFEFAGADIPNHDVEITIFGAYEYHKPLLKTVIYEFENKYGKTIFRPFGLHSLSILLHKDGSIFYGATDTRGEVSVDRNLFYYAGIPDELNQISLINQRRPFLGFESGFYALNFGLYVPMILPEISALGSPGERHESISQLIENCRKALESESTRTDPRGVKMFEGMITFYESLQDAWSKAHGSKDPIPGIAFVPTELLAQYSAAELNDIAILQRMADDPRVITYDSLSDNSQFFINSIQDFSIHGDYLPFCTYDTVRALKQQALEVVRREEPFHFHLAFKQEGGVYRLLSPAIELARTTQAQAGIATNRRYYNEGDFIFKSGTVFPKEGMRYLYGITKRPEYEPGEDEKPENRFGNILSLSPVL